MLLIILEGQKTDKKKARTLNEKGARYWHSWPRNWGKDNPMPPAGHDFRIRNRNSAGQFRFYSSLFEEQVLFLPTWMSAW